MEFSKLTSHFCSETPETMTVFSAATRPGPVQQLYARAGRQEELGGGRARGFVCIPITRSLYASTRRYLDVETETKRVSSAGRDVRGEAVLERYWYRMVFTESVRGRFSLVFAMLVCPYVLILFVPLL